MKRPCQCDECTHHTEYRNTRLVVWPVYACIVAILLVAVIARFTPGS